MKISLWGLTYDALIQHPFEFGNVVCMNCKAKIEKEEFLKVFQAGVAHVDCELLKSRKVSGVNPQAAAERKTSAKASKKKGSKATAGEAAAFGGDVEKAKAKHDHLMIIAKPLQRKGKAKGDSWRIRYEPIKRFNASWVHTRHQVVFRWGDGGSKTVPFEFDEEHKSDEQFVAEVNATMDMAVKDNTT